MTATTAFDRITAALIAHGSKVQLHGDRRSIAQCPAHPDSNPSLSLGHGDSSVLIRCHAGCDTDDVLAALRLTRAHLFDGDPNSGASESRPAVVAQYDYQDEDGAILFTKIRCEPKRFRITPPGAIRSLPVKPLYRLPAVRAAAGAGDTVYLVEGEKDADALAELGLTATCNYEGAAKDGQKPKWRPEYVEQLAGSHVVIVADRDEPGRVHAKAAAASLKGRAASLRVVQARTGKDISDHLAAGHTVAELEPLAVEDRQPCADEPPQANTFVDEVFPVIDWGDLWAEVPDSVEWVCEPLLERGRSTVIYSAPKIGKSLLSLEVAAALCCGRSVLGNPNRMPLTVLYVDLENTAADIKERLQALDYGPPDLARLRYLSFPSLAALDTAEGGRQLTAVVDHHQAEVVVIDTVSRIISGPEDAADTFAALYRHALVPLKAKGVTVLRLDHAGKDVTRGQRGSSAKSADVDHVWRLTGTPGRFVLKRDASRTGHGSDQLTLVRRHEPLRHELAGSSAVTTRVAEVVARLDHLRVPQDAGRERCRVALAAGDFRIGNATLAAAVTLRKNRAAQSEAGRTAEDPVSDNADCPRGENDGDIAAGASCPGQAADR